MVVVRGLQLLNDINLVVAEEEVEVTVPEAVMLRLPSGGLKPAVDRAMVFDRI